MHDREQSLVMAEPAAAALESVDLRFDIVTGVITYDVTGTANYPFVEMSLVAGMESFFISAAFARSSARQRAHVRLSFPFSLIHCSLMRLSLSPSLSLRQNLRNSLGFGKSFPEGFWLVFQVVFDLL